MSFSLSMASTAPTRPAHVSRLIAGLFGVAVVAAGAYCVERRARRGRPRALRDAGEPPAAVVQAPPTAKYIAAYDAFLAGR